VSVGVEVDALALMLDGVRGYYRRGEAVFWLEKFGGASMLGTLLARPGMADVAEAILELEAWADWISSDADDSYCPETLGELGRAARAACKHIPRRPSIVFLEAAARLRDGWRPEGWRRQ
jgi:hypothetical protein